MGVAHGDTSWPFGDGLGPSAAGKEVGGWGPALAARRSLEAGRWGDAVRALADRDDPLSVAVRARVLSLLGRGDDARADAQSILGAGGPPAALGLAISSLADAAGTHGTTLA